MQRIERYGVIALVFLLVTIVAVSLWGERKKTDGWFSFLKRDSKASRVEELLADASVTDAGGEPIAQRNLVDESVPLSGTEWKGVGQTPFEGPEQAPSEYRDLHIGETDSVVPQPQIPSGPLASYVATPPPVETKVPVTPSAAQPREYTIRPGDTLSEISQRELGTKNRWRELVELNPGLDPAHLSVGTKIRLTASVPTVAQAQPKPALKVATPPKGDATARPAAAGRSYTVRSGDTLSQIAQRELGSKERWRELVELNPGLDPARMHVGRVLRLPGGEPQRDTRVARAETAPTAPVAAPQKSSKVR